MTKFLQGVRTTNAPSRVVPYMAFSNKSKMAAAAIFNFGKMSITPDWIKTSVPYFMGRCILAMRRWPHDQKSKPSLIRVTSSSESQKHISVSISVTITYIWTKFGTELKYHTINTLEWSNSHNLKLRDGGYRRLGFLGYEKKMSITPDWIKISAPNGMWRCITAMRRWPRDQRSKPEVNSRERLKHKCVDRSSQCIYFNPIWYRTQIPHCQHTWIAKFT